MGSTPRQTDGRQEALNYRKWRAQFSRELPSILMRLRAPKPAASVINWAITNLIRAELYMPPAKGGRPPSPYEAAVLLIAVQLTREGVSMHNLAAEIVKKIGTAGITKTVYSRAGKDAPLSVKTRKALSGPITEPTVRKLLTPLRREQIKELAKLDDPGLRPQKQK